MTPRLAADEVAHHVRNLRERSSLTALQAARLDAIIGTLSGSGRFLLRDALEAAEFPDGDTRGQEAFQDFRKRVNKAAADVGVDLQLHLDSRKARPDERYGWFTGGDLVDEGIASFTGAAAGRTGIAHPVSPEVTEIGPGSRIRVYVSVVPDRRTAALLERFRQTLALDRERGWDVVDTGSVGLGTEPDEARDRHSERADIRVALVSPRYLASEERRRALDRPGRTVAFAVSALPDGPLDLGPLARHDVHGVDTPWDELSRTEQRRRYVGELVAAVRREVQRPVRAARTDDESLEVWTSSIAWRRRSGESAVPVPQEAAEASLRESRLDGIAAMSGPAQPAVDRLVDWATGGGPALCALLGDVGMGKTTTAKLFTQRLLELRRGGTRSPLPLLFDLRDVRVGELAGSMTLDQILDGMLAATRPPDVPSSRLNAAVVRQRLAQGDAVVVFDGLDEVLVHLSPHDQKLFTRQLWRAAEGGVRMLVTCRTQYFRTIRDEIGYFTGEDRQGLRGEQYLALLMQPFRDEQVREYLQSNVDREGDWVDGFLETVAAVHDLTDLSHRPLTLRLIADQVEFIETAKLQGCRVRSVDLYGEVVDRWLSRDSGKHTLTPEHKRLLMEEIAAGLWRSGRNSWNASEVDNWLLDLLDRRPDLQLHYRERVPDLWKADFRTATFLARDRGDDTFAFGHRSLFEYFLARYLFRTLGELGTAADPVAAPLAMSVPSTETLEFLAQSIAGTTGYERENVLGGLDRTREPYVTDVSELAFAYAVHAFGRGYPHHRLDRVRLGGIDLAWAEIGGPDTPVLSMTGADLASARLRGAKLHGLDLTDADLSGSDLDGAELHRCRLDSATLRGARMAGTILRQCTLSGAHLDDVDAYRAQALLCSPSPPEVEGLLVAPSPGEPAVTGRMRLLGPPTGVVRAVSWSPDSTRILTGGHGGIRIWDAIVDEVLVAHAAHVGGVRVVAWSPDGTRLLTGGNDDGWIWDATTAIPQRPVTNQMTGVTRASWSPDGTRILIGGAGGVRILDASTGAVLHQDDAMVSVAAWSADGTGILTAGREGLRVWDACLDSCRTVAGPAGTVLDAAWSPDGTRILIGGEDGVRILDATTGSCLNQVDALVRGLLVVAWSPDGTDVVAGDRHGMLRFWNATTGAPHRMIGPGPVEWIRSVSWSPRGTQGIAIGNGGLLAWDEPDAGRTRRLPEQWRWVTALTWSADGTRLLMSANDGDVRILDAGSGGALRRLPAARELTTRAAAWSPDTTRLATIGNDGVLRIREATTGTAQSFTAEYTDAMSSVAWSPDGTRIVGGGPVRAQIWDARTGEPTATLPDTITDTGQIAWSPDGTRIAVAWGDNTCIVDATPGGIPRQIMTHGRFVSAVGWSPDGGRIVSGDDEGTVRTWDARTGTELFRVDGPVDTIQAVAWSGDGRWIASACSDGVRIHDGGTGDTVHHAGDHADWAQIVAWSPDSTRLASAGYDGTIRIIDAATGRPAGAWYALLPDMEMAVFDAEAGSLVGASSGAWRWLGWNTMQDGLITRLPAETFGPLPPLALDASAAGQ